MTVRMLLPVIFSSKRTFAEINGRNTDGSSTLAGTNDRCWAMGPFTPASNGKITSMGLRWLSSAAGNVKFIVFSNSAGAPDSNLGVSNPCAINNTGAVDLTATFSTPISILSSSSYFLGFVCDGTVVGNAQAKTSATGITTYRQETFTYASPAATFGTPAGTSANYSGYIFAKYRVNKT